MRTVIHVNQGVLRANRASGAREPALTLKRSSAGKVTRAHEAVARDGSGREMFRVVYRPDNPLPCGAVCWVETELEVSPLNFQECHMSGPTITLNSGAALSDSGVLSGGASPTGTITFTLNAPNGTLVYTDHVTVSGNGTYNTSMGDHPGGLKWSVAEENTRVKHKPQQLTAGQLAQVLRAVPDGTPVKFNCSLMTDEERAAGATRFGKVDLNGCDGSVVFDIGGGDPSNPR